jgi:hypothetical protein
VSGQGGDTKVRQQKGRRRHRDEATEGEEKDVISDLLLKHSNTTLAAYV